MIFSDEYNLRFGGIARLYGTKELAKLASAHVLIVGLGGVGSWVVEALTRSGIGQLTIVDLDDVCITNTNRQLCATVETIGHSKALTLKKRAQSINPEIKINCIEEFFSEKTFENIISTSYDFVVDCIDSLDSKCLLVSECHKRNIPIITIGGAAGKIDPTQIKIDDLAFSMNDSLLQRLRKKLRRDYGFKKTPGKSLKSRKKMGIFCLYSPEPQRYPNANGEVCNTPDPETNLKLDCQTGMGSSLMVTGTFAFMAASIVVKEITQTSR